jgi:hypothetical protein
MGEDPNPFAVWSEDGDFGDLAAPTRRHRARPAETKDGNCRGIRNPGKRVGDAQKFKTVRAHFGYRAVAADDARYAPTAKSMSLESALSLVGDTDCRVILRTIRNLRFSARRCVRITDVKFHIVTCASLNDAKILRDGRPASGTVIIDEYYVNQYGPNLSHFRRHLTTEHVDPYQGLRTLLESKQLEPLRRILVPFDHLGQIHGLVRQMSTQPAREAGDDIGLSGASKDAVAEKAEKPGSSWVSVHSGVLVGWQDQYRRSLQLVSANSVRFTAVNDDSVPDLVPHDTTSLAAESAVTSRADSLVPVQTTRSASTDAASKTDTVVTGPFGASVVAGNTNTNAAAAISQALIPCVGKRVTRLRDCTLSNPNPLSANLVQHGASGCESWRGDPWVDEDPTLRTDLMIVDGFLSGPYALARSAGNREIGCIRRSANLVPGRLDDIRHIDPAYLSGLAKRYEVLGWSVRPAVLAYELHMDEDGKLDGVQKFYFYQRLSGSNLSFSRCWTNGYHNILQFSAGFRIGGKTTNPATDGKMIGFGYAHALPDLKTTNTVFGPIPDVVKRVAIIRFFFHGKEVRLVDWAKHIHRTLQLDDCIPNVLFAIVLHYAL